jgi:HAD superfamily hydrolase (TIGR01549 family)
MDGVLLQGAETDSKIYEIAASQTLTRMTDGNVSEDDLSRINGFHYTQEMETVCKELNVKIEDFWKQREQIAAELENEDVRKEKRQPFDDVGVLKDLTQSYKLGVVSNNRQATVDQAVSILEIEFIDVAIGRDHSLEGYYDRKPEPTLIINALEKLETKDALYVGDSEKDIIAASRANVDSAFIHRPHNSKLVINKEPDIRLDSLAELKNELKIP